MTSISASLDSGEIGQAGSVGPRGRLCGGLVGRAHTRAVVSF